MIINPNRRMGRVDTADEFYSVMAVLTREMLDFGIIDTNELIEVYIYITCYYLPCFLSLFSFTTLCTDVLSVITI
jgi:hypothetical protein